MQIPTTEYVSVTPQQARAWLKTNTTNRNLSESVVDAYANDMRIEEDACQLDELPYSRS